MTYRGKPLFRLGDVIDKVRAKNINPIVLAFVGDAVYSLYVRESLVFSSDYKAGELNKLATARVKATAQAEFIKSILPILTEEEFGVFKRGRNAKKSTKAKHATVSEYNLSTGFEALLGYLYVIGDLERINYLLDRGNEDEN